MLEILVTFKILVKEFITASFKGEEILMITVHFEMFQINHKQ